MKAVPPMKAIRQRALVVVSERIKPFSSRLEFLSMKLANFVRLTHRLIDPGVKPRACLIPSKIKDIQMAIILDATAQ